MEDGPDKATAVAHRVDLRIKLRDARLPVGEVEQSSSLGREPVVRRVAVDAVVEAARLVGLPTDKQLVLPAPHETAVTGEPR